MPENPYAAPQTDTPIAPEMAVVDELRAIASYQRWIQLVILIQIIPLLSLVTPLGAFLGPWPAVLFWITGIAGTVFAVLLALRVYNVVLAIVFGFFTIWPCIGLLCLLAINQRATSRLQEFQIPVGLLGADMDELEKRVQQIQQYGLPPGPPTA